jgi:5'-3' exonuclease
MSKDPIFETTLTKRVEECLEKIIKKEKLSWSNVIFAKDCRQSDIWRNEIIDKYKGTRDKSINVKTGFTIISDKIKDLIETRGCLQYHHPKLEADDVAYLYRKYILEKVDPLAKFLIITSDIDYYQICYPNTKILRLDNRDAMTKSCGNPKKDLLLKIISGDKSDNICAILPKCGNKTAQKYCEDAELLNKLLLENSKANELFERNKTIIDFSEIPNNLQIEMTDKFPTIIGEQELH